MPKVLWKFGDDVSTDIIYPGRFMATVLPTETPQYAFSDIPELHNALNQDYCTKGQVIVTGKNFGCGSSREQAVSTLTGHNVIVIAKNFARIFLQNAINLGLKIIICPEIEAEKGDEIVFTGDKVFNLTNEKEFSIIPLPKARQTIIDAGGLIPYVRARLIEK